MSPDRLDPLRQSLNLGILDRLTEALQNCDTLEPFSHPVLRLEAFVQEGNKDTRSKGEPALVASVKSKARRDCVWIFLLTVFAFCVANSRPV